MAGSVKIKIIDNKIKQNKAQYNLDRTTVKIVTLSLGHVITFEILTGKDVLPEKRLVIKSSCNQRYSSIFTIRLCLEKHDITKVEIAKSIPKD